MKRSIGYGDIVPVSDAEYIVGIACQLIGGFWWAYVSASQSFLFFLVLFFSTNTKIETVNISKSRLIECAINASL